MIRVENFNNETKSSEVYLRGSGGYIIKEYACGGVAIFNAIMKNEKLSNKDKVGALLLFGDEVQDLMKDIVKALEDLKE